MCIFVVRDRCVYCFSDAVDVSCVADSGIAILTVLASPEYAGRHGACRITEQVSIIY